MTRCIAVIGQSGVGKSALVDQLAGLEGGRPPNGAGSDFRCVPFSFLGDRWAAIDCPGSIEFLQQSMDALLVADAAVVVASPDPDQAVLAAPFLRLVERAKVPALIFVNRMDENRARLSDIAAALQAYSGRPLVLRQIPMREGDRIVGAIDLVSERAWRYRHNEPSDLVEIPADLLPREQEARSGLLESLADHDDTLLEQIIEDKVPASDAVYAICARLLRDEIATQMLIGAAANSNGIVRLMKALRHEVPGPEAVRARLGGALAVAFAGRHRKHIGKATWLRLFAGGLGQGSQLGGGTIGGMIAAGGDKPTPVTATEVGDVVTAVKSDHLAPGRLNSAVGELETPAWYRPLPAQFARVVTAKHERDDVKLSEAFGKLASDDPSLSIRHDAETGAQIIESQGIQHLRWARDVLADVFGVETEEHPAPPAYRETISRPADVHFRHRKQSGGAGQFADIKIKVAPGERGTGYTFDEIIHGGSVPRNYIPAVEHGAREACDRGPLGFPAVDVHVTLYDGQYHSVDSSDMAFRIAGRGGMQQAMAEAGPVLLEPFYEVRFEIPQAFTGALSPLVSSRRGQIMGYDRDPDAAGWDVFRALMPGSALDTLIADLRSVTQGIGRFEAAFDHYQELYGREADMIIEARAQDTQGQRARGAA